MPKAKIAYVCTECGAHSVKWAGQCPDCSAWNTLAQTRIAPLRGKNEAASAPASLDSLPDDLEHRHMTGFEEFDRVLGGGLVPGAVVLLGGDPGVGKSTLLQQVSIGQRSQRLGLSSADLQLLADTSLENVLGQAQASSAKILVIDSIQTMSSTDLPSAPGSVAQLRECVGRVVQFAGTRSFVP